MPREIVFLSEELQPLRFRASARRCRVVLPLKGRGSPLLRRASIERRFNRAMRLKRLRIGEA